MITPAVGDFETQAFGEAALEAAQHAACLLDLATGKLRWAGAGRAIFGPDFSSRFPSIESLTAAVDLVDRENFVAALHHAREAKSSFRIDFRLQTTGQPGRWIAARGHCYGDANGSADRFLCVFEDATDRKRIEFELLEANAGLKAINERLQTGVAESHHRVKNSLQNVISLLNLQIRKSGTLSADQVKKLSTLIHGLAVLHDLLNEQARENGDLKSVSVDRVFERVVGIATRGNDGRKVESKFDPSPVTPRQAASLNVIFNELVSNALKHGSGPIEIALDRDGDRAVLKVKNEGSQFPPDFSAQSGGQAGLALVKLLCSSDLNCEPVFSNEDSRHAVASVAFALVSPVKDRVQSQPSALAPSL